MAGPQQKLVNKQFNSPIGLYSEQNIKEVLERESQMLANGAVGINFQNPSVMTKPANLHNSAVLRMLEEEESRQRNGKSPGVKRVAWPPPKDEEEGEFVEQEAIQAQGGAQFTSKTPGLLSTSQTTPFNNQQQAPAVAQTYQPNKPAWSPVRSPVPPSPSVPAPQSPAILPTAPQPFRQEYTIPIQIESRVQPKPFNRDITPAKPTQPPQGQPQQPPQQPQYRPAPVKQIEPPPSIITLRPTVPISQAPAPVFTSQPATATLKGGKNLRGDIKWPPEDVKERMEAENRARMELAKGPSVRPRKVQKDYSGFFAQHALNSTYPGYKVPPGTQYYEHHPVM